MSHREPGRNRTAHPRSRGENLCPRPSTAPYAGSSPLTRGKPRAVVLARALAGLIPAHAGKTWKASRAYCRAWAHPRSRGENRQSNVGGVSARGSSPLTRGKRSARRGRKRLTGLIPAHAGKTARSHARGRRTAAHPRSRGENSALGGLTGMLPGSSPLTRGKP